MMRSEGADGIYDLNRGSLSCSVLMRPSGAGFWSSVSDCCGWSCGLSCCCCDGGCSVDTDGARTEADRFCCCCFVVGLGVAPRRREEAEDEGFVMRFGAERCAGACAAACAKAASSSSR